MGGVFESKDDGRTFDLMPGSPLADVAIAISPIDQNILYVSSFSVSTNTYGLFKSTNGGITWNLVNHQVFNSLSVDPYNNSIVIGEEYSSDYYGNPEISFNGGNTFTSLNFETVNCPP